MSKVRAELAAAAAICAGILLAGGYLLTLAKLANKGLPADSVLPALPKTYYIGVALQSMWLPFLTVVTVGALWFRGVALRSDDKLPGYGHWAVAGVALAFYSLVATQVLYPEGLGHAPANFFIAAGVGVIVFAFVSMGVGWGASYFLAQHTSPGRSERDALAGAAVLILCVLAAVSFRAITVRYLPDALINAIVHEDPAACPIFKDRKEKPEQGCGEVGYYLGESGSWVYLVLQAPRNCDDVEDPNHLVQIARSKIHRVILYRDKHPPLLPPCPR